MTQLAALNESIADLRDTHRTLEGRLRRLLRHGHLTPSEQTLARQLKKEKLLAKDRIQRMLHASD